MRPSIAALRRGIATPAKGGTRGGRTGYDGGPMLRRLFTILSAASLLLCVVTCGIWVRTTFQHDVWEREVRHVTGAYWRSNRTESTPGSCGVLSGVSPACN